MARPTATLRAPVPSPMSGIPLLPAFTGTSSLIAAVSSSPISMTPTTEISTALTLARTSLPVFSPPLINLLFQIPASIPSPYTTPSSVSPESSLLPLSQEPYGRRSIDPQLCNFDVVFVQVEKKIFALNAYLFHHSPVYCQAMALEYSNGKTSLTHPFCIPGVTVAQLRAFVTFMTNLPDINLDDSTDVTMVVRAALVCHSLQIESAFLCAMYGIRGAHSHVSRKRTLQPPRPLATPFTPRTYPWTEMLQLVSRANLVDLLSKFQLLLFTTLAENPHNIADNLLWAYGMVARGEAKEPRRMVAYLLISHGLIDRLPDHEQPLFRRAEALTRFYARWLYFHMVEKQQCPFQWIRRTQSGDALPRAVPCIAPVAVAPQDFWVGIFYGALREGMYLYEQPTPVATRSWNFVSLAGAAQRCLFAVVQRDNPVTHGRRRSRCRCCRRIMDGFAKLQAIFDKEFDGALDDTDGVDLVEQDPEDTIVVGGFLIVDVS